MKNDFAKYIAGLLLFGANGVIASFIALDSRQIVLLRAVLASALLLVIFFLSGKRFSSPQSTHIEISTSLMMS